MTGVGLAARYGLFAALATAANLAAQRFVLGDAPSPRRLVLALAVGTLVGLAAKYVLDARWIFRAAPLGPLGRARRVGRYAGTGAITTLVFWGTEAAFYAASPTTSARETGALLGLAAGYALKYRLDRRLVFGPADGTGRAAA